MNTKFAWAMALGMATAGAAGTKIIGYVPTWSGDVATIPYQQLTHVNYAFALPDTNGEIKPIDDPQRFKDLVSTAKAANPQIKILISVGGWSDAGEVLDARMEAIGADPAKRARLVQGIMAWVREYGLDGVDMDWEFPNAGASADNFEALMSSLSDSLKPQGKLLTAAVTASGAAGAGVKASLFPKLDFVNVMAYDDYGAANHSSMEYAQNALSYWTVRGLPPEKIVLGVPFYGVSKSGGQVPYRTLLAQDTSAWNKDCVGTTCYNGIPTLQLKTDLGAFKGGGVMIWELSEDVQGPKSLLTAISDRMNANRDSVAKILAQKPDSTVKGVALSDSLAKLGTLLDDMGSPGVNWAGGLWFGDSDYWERSTAERGKGKQAVVWDLDKTKDLALGNGTWGDLSPGYIVDPVSKKPHLATIFEVYRPVSTQLTYNYAGLIMEFEPRNCEMSPEACWEIEKTGVSKNMSATTAIHLGMRCDSGKKVWVDLVPQNINYAYPTWGKRVTCTGQPEIYTLQLDSLETKYKSDSAVPALNRDSVFRLRVIWGDDTLGLAATNQISLYGVAETKSSNTPVWPNNRATSVVVQSADWGFNASESIRSAQWIRADGRVQNLNVQGKQALWAGVRPVGLGWLRMDLGQRSWVQSFMLK